MEAMLTETLKQARLPLFLIFSIRENGVLMIPSVFDWYDFDDLFTDWPHAHVICVFDLTLLATERNPVCLGLIVFITDILNSLFLNYEGLGVGVNLMMILVKFCIFHGHEAFWTRSF